MKFFLLIVLIACSKGKVVEQIDAVSLAPSQASGSDSIVINKSSNEDTPEVSAVAPETKKIPIISLTLYSSIYHSLAMLNLIKEIDKTDLEIAYISSQGFGAVLAGLYAKKKSISNVEWSLFKLLKELKGEKVYSKSWNTKMYDFIDSEFKGMTFSQLKLKMIIPLLIDGKKIDFISTGKMADALKNNLKLTASNNYYQKPMVYHYLMERFGIDFSMAVSFLPRAPSFNHLNGYSYGVVTRFLGVVMNAKEEVNIITTESSLALDKLLPLADLNQIYATGISNYMEHITQAYKNWQEDSSSGFQFQ